MTRWVRRENDSGAVAVLVAVITSVVLLIAGALTVDLGSVWVERTEVRDIAEAAALAGAAMLPQDPLDDLDPEVEENARAAAIRILCADGNRRPGWDDPAVCPVAGVPSWAFDRVEANGEVEPVRAEPGSFPSIDPDQDTVLPWVLRVVTPPSRVTFGVARAAGRTGTTVSASAGARRGVPFPVDGTVADIGFPGPPFAASPYYLTLDDLREAPDKADALTCLRTTPVPVAADEPVGEAPEPTPPPAFVVGVADEVSFDVLTPQRIRLTGLQLGDLPAPTDGADIDPAPIKVFLGGTQRRFPADVTRFRYDLTAGAYEAEVRTPDLTGEGVFGDVSLWFEYDVPSGPPVEGVSDSITLTYPSAPPLDLVGDCDTEVSAAGRGLLAPLDPDSVGPAPEPLSVTASVTRGLPVHMNPFGSFPRAQRSPGSGIDCDAFAISDPGAAVRPESSDVAEREVNCLPLRPGHAVSPADLTTAWLGRDGPSPVEGRLQRECSTQRSTISGRAGTFDTTSLFSRTGGLPRDSVDPNALRNRIFEGKAADGDLRGAISVKAFRCPRFLLLPVVDTDRPPTAGRYPVVGLTYFYVSDVGGRSRRALRGLMTTLTTPRQVVGIRGWIVDPGYVQGGDWVARDGDPDSLLPMAVPERAVLTRTPCDDHPDSAECPP